MYPYALITILFTASALHVPLVPRVDECDGSVADTQSASHDFTNTQEGMTTRHRRRRQASNGHVCTTSTAAPSSTVNVRAPLETTGVSPGLPVKIGTELRILPVGDSITVGYEDTSGLNGYRRELQHDLSADKLVFAGTEVGGTMCDGYFAAWSGQTIDYIASQVGPSLAQRPNIILLHAGTNDMNANPSIAKQGNDPTQAVQRLGILLDQMIAACPDAVILVAQIIPTIQTDSESSSKQEDRTIIYNRLIPSMVAPRAQAGHHVLTVNFGSFPTSALNPGGVHLTPAGYSLMGDWWYDFIHQISTHWINAPGGPDPVRPPCEAVDIGHTNATEPPIPKPSSPPTFVRPASPSGVAAAANGARVSHKPAVHFGLLALFSLVWLER